MPRALSGVAALIAFSGLTGPLAVAAQVGPVTDEVSRDDATPLDSLVRSALDANPSVRAAERRVEAARARIGPAGSLPDPMLSAGVMNLPVADPGMGEPMMMNTVGLGQRLPYPGKLSLARRAAELEVRAAEARLDDVRLVIEAEVRKAYYDLAFFDRSLVVLERNQALLVDFIGVTESRYGVGIGGQEDILKARVEAARLAEEAVALTEGRRSRLARLNALLDRPTGTAVDEARVPERIARAAIADDLSRVRFTSERLGARVADSPLPPVEALQERAALSSPEVRSHQAAIAAQAARLELARKAHLPDFDVSVQYGQRFDRADMASVMVSVPLPVRRRDRQGQEAAEAEAELAAMRAEHHAMVNRINADVAGAYADLERERARLALFARSIIPQGRAALESATAAYQVGRADFLTLLENQTTLHDYEIAYFRSLTDFARTLAELERMVGTEVLP
ncbi:MAG TPA: TolC family protein [Gemmatimonadota bacterium]|nr:TolC family protein [Gemmatimonadota bacterium]